MNNQSEINLEDMGYRRIVTGDSESDNELYWSNTQGWVDFADADVFTVEESERFLLPLEGMWKRARDVDAITHYFRAIYACDARKYFEDELNDKCAIYEGVEGLGTKVLNAFESLDDEHKPDCSEMGFAGLAAWVKDAVISESNKSGIKL